MARHLQKIALSIVFLTACSSSPLMTRGDFDSIQNGTSVAEVDKEYGRPSEVRYLKDGSQEYKYIERIPMGDQVIQENRYYLIIKNGKVISKRYNQELPEEYNLLYQEDPNAIEN